VGRTTMMVSAVEKQCGEMWRSNYAVWCSGDDSPAFVISVELTPSCTPKETGRLTDACTSQAVGLSPLPAYPLRRHEPCITATCSMPTSATKHAATRCHTNHIQVHDCTALQQL
jgi:hypothetical protein